MLTLRDATIDTQVNIENLKIDMASFKGDTYLPSYNLEDLYNLKNSSDKIPKQDYKNLKY